MSRPLLSLWAVTPDVAVGVDDGLCIVLVTAEGKGPRWTISNADDLKWALDRAREYVQVREAVMADWEGDPAQGRDIIERMYLPPGEAATR